MTYLSRPVFEFPINWAGAPAPTWLYDLREIQKGFGRPSYAATQSNLLQGFSFNLQPTTDAEIQTIEDFFDALFGNLTGFWLPGPQIAFEIVAGVSSTQFEITDQGLAESWQAHPSGAFVYFTKEGSSAQAAQISAVTDLGNGRERITVTGAMGTAVDATWTAHRLHYVRLASAEEEFTALTEGTQSRAIKVVELPEEYASVETGLRPVYLYHFWIDWGASVTHWRYTSFQEDLVSDGNTFSAANINHGALRDSLRGDREDVTIEAVFETGGPFVLFSSLPPAKRLFVEILEADYSALDDAEVLFTGQVLDPDLDGRGVKAKCASLLDALGTAIPGMVVQRRCNYNWGDPRTCKVEPEDFAVTTTISALDGHKVTLAGGAGVDANWYALGRLQTGSGTSFEIAGILKSSDAGAGLELWLMAPLRYAAVSQSVKIYPGCNKTTDHCDNKFSNYPENYGGHPFVPRHNLTLAALPVATPGGKK